MASVRAILASAVVSLLGVHACAAPIVAPPKAVRAATRQVLAPQTPPSPSITVPPSTMPSGSGPTGSTAPSPGPMALHDRVSDRVNRGVEAIARANFAQGRGVLGVQAPDLLRARAPGRLLSDATTSLLSNNGGGLLSNNSGGLISNNGGGLLSNNSGGLISNNGGGLISNNSGGLVSSNGGGLVSSNGGGLVSSNGGGLVSSNGGGLVSSNGGGLVSSNGGAYRLLQVAGVPSLVPLPGEFLLARREWLTGGTLLQFARPKVPVRHYVRYVGQDATGKVVLHTSMDTESYRPDGTAQAVRFRRDELDGVGQLRLSRTHVETYGSQDRLLRAAFGPEPCVVRYPELGVDVAIERYSIDLEKGIGQFRYRFGQFGFIEEGVLRNVSPDAQGRLYFSEFDALMAYDGDSEVKDERGRTLFTKRRTLVNGRVAREYGLGDGLTVKLLADDRGVFRGVLDERGVTLADVAMVMLYDGTTMFRFDYRDQPDAPQFVGFGEMPVAVPSAPPTPPVYRVETIAGAEAGIRDGDAATARFGELRALVASTQVKDRFYAADAMGNRIVRIDRTGDRWQFMTVAGNGEAGYVDGPGAQSRWFGPYGLAIGPNDELYVSDIGNERIRRVRFGAGGAVVDTIAGSGASGFADGPGVSAQFSMVTSLVRAGNLLYAADGGNRRIRRIDLVAAGHPVTTLAGSGLRGGEDGDAATASFEVPETLVVREGRYLVVAETNVNRLRQIDLSNLTVTTLLGTSGAPQFWYDGPTSGAGVERPVVLFDAGVRGLWTGQVQLRALLNSGQLRTVAGRTDSGWADGGQDAAAFEGITGIAPLSDGSWLLTDLTRVRRLIAP